MQQHKYQKIIKLGQGSFADVYKVKKIGGEKDGHIFALKEVQITFDTEDRVLEEVNKLKELKGDHIIEYYDSYLVDCELNIVMSLCDGNLRNIIQNGHNFSVEDILSLIIQITSAMMILGEKGVMHLDLKPDNILYTGERVYKICDFGCSRQTKLSSYQRIRIEDANFGTPRYICPEIRLGRMEISKNSTDVWSLGVIVYEIIYKKHPLKLSKSGEIDYPNLCQFWNSKVEIEYPKKSKQHQLLINGLLKQMLQSNPQNRPTWKKIKSELIRYFHREEIEFEPSRKAFEKLKLTFFIVFAVLAEVTDNVSHNPHKFWASQKGNLNQLLILLLKVNYLHFVKFNKLLQYKLNLYLQKKNLKFIEQSTAFLKVEIDRRTKSTKLQVEELEALEHELLEVVNEIMDYFETELKEQELWASIKKMQTFCEEVQKLKTLFCKGHRMKGTLNAFGIQQ